MNRKSFSARASRLPRSRGLLVRSREEWGTPTSGRWGTPPGDGREMAPAAAQADDVIRACAPGPKPDSRGGGKECSFALKPAQLSGAFLRPLPSWPRLPSTP